MEVGGALESRAKTIYLILSDAQSANIADMQVQYFQLLDF